MTSTTDPQETRGDEDDEYCDEESRENYLLLEKKLSQAKEVCTIEHNIEHNGVVWMLRELEFIYARTTRIVAMDGRITNVIRLLFKYYSPRDGKVVYVGCDFFDSICSFRVNATFESILKYPELKYFFDSIKLILFK